MKIKTGQNFLIKKEIAEREVDYADIQKDDIVLEIGPGNGIITKLISEKAKQVIAIELDKKLFFNLKSFLPDNVLLINDDVLKVDFSCLPKFNKIISNLPFQISSPITFKFLESKFELAILIYQKEFAERMVAIPGNKNYSRLSVSVYYHAYCEILEYVSKNCFNPKPKVDSCIVKLFPCKPPFNIIDKKFFFDLTKELFNHRRKKIKTTISKFYNISEFQKIPFLNQRVEELSPEQIGELSNILFNQNIKK